MGYPGPGPITRYYRNCLLCGCPFAVRPYEVHLTDRGKFCSRMCYHSSRHLFTQALADGRLDVILAPEREAARRARAVQKMDEYTARKLADRMDGRVDGRTRRHDHGSA